MPIISRRNLLKSTVGAGVLLGVYGGYKALTKPGPLDVIHSQALPIPPLLTGEVTGGQKIFDLTMQKGLSDFIVGKKTETWGYNGNILGPTLLMQKGDDVVINVTNNLGEATTTHWHGLHLPSKMDGGPYQIIEDGATWKAQFKIMNEAASYFYHPHLFHKTAEQFYRGLAGMLIIKDPENEPDLPDQYGIDDIPLIIQGKSLRADGSLDYGGNDDGVKGAYAMVNGAITPVFQAPAQMVRFRVLNASNARIYNFGFSDNRQFHQIGTDGGLLEKPVALTRLVLSPAERAEIVVDFSGQEDSQLRFVSYSDEISDLTPFWARDALDGQTIDLLTIDVIAAAGPAIRALPDALARFDRLQESQASVTRVLSLEMTLFGKMTINGQGMDLERIDQRVKLGATEIWELTNPSPMAHPFHIHDIQFQILSRNGQMPPENEQGWKDVVLVKQNETVRFIASFTEFADPEIPYMYHCHILEHEDGGMMGQFLVV